jgi:hypothetical protein
MTAASPPAVVSVSLLMRLGMRLRRYVGLRVASHRDRSAPQSVQCQAAG